MDKQGLTETESFSRVGGVVMAEAVFTLSDVGTKTGADKAQLSHWVRVGLIVPAVRQSAGTGDPRLFDAFNVLQAAVARALAAFRIPAPVLGEALGPVLARAYRDNLRWLILDGERVFVSDDRAPGVEKDGVLLIDLQRLRRRIGV